MEILLERHLFFVVIAVTLKTNIDVSKVRLIKVSVSHLNITVVIILDILIKVGVKAVCI